MCLAFRTSLRHAIIDVLTFLIIFYTAKRSGVYRHPGIPCLLDTILRDATLHFMLVFYAQVLSQFFLLLAPVGGA